MKSAISIVLSTLSIGVHSIPVVYTIAKSEPAPVNVQVLNTPPQTHHTRFEQTYSETPCPQEQKVIYAAVQKEPQPEPQVVYIQKEEAEPAPITLVPAQQQQPNPPSPKYVFLTKKETPPPPPTPVIIAAPPAPKTVVAQPIEYPAVSY